MEDCIFCRIIDREILSKIVYEDEYILAFEDIEAQAPVHVLVIPKQHIPSLNDIDEENASVISHIYTKIPDIAKKLDIYDSGYRVVVNCGSDGGQTVAHLHYHVLGGRALAWPPG